MQCNVILSWGGDKSFANECAKFYSTKVKRDHKLDLEIKPNLVLPKKEKLVVTFNEPGQIDEEDKEVTLWFRQVFELPMSTAGTFEIKQGSKSTEAVFTRPPPDISSILIVVKPTKDADMLLIQKVTLPLPARDFLPQTKHNFSCAYVIT